MIFLIILSSLAVGFSSSADAAVGIEDVFLTLGDLLRGAGAAAGAAGLDVSGEFGNDPLADSEFRKKKGNEVYVSTQPTTNEYFAKAITALEEIDGYYADWNAVYNAIEYQNEHRFYNGGYPFLCDLVDCKFSVAELVEMGLLKPVTLTDNNTYWVTNIGYNSTGYIKDLEARKAFISLLQSNAKKVDVIKSYFLDKINLYDSAALPAIEKLLDDRAGGTLGSYRAYALTRTYAFDRKTAIGYMFYYGDLIKVPNKDGTYSRFTSDGIEYYHLGWVGGRFSLDNFFQIRSYSVGGLHAAYGLEGFDYPLRVSDSFIGAGDQDCLVRFASEYYDTYNRNAPLMIDTLDVEKVNSYNAYIDNRIDFYRENEVNDVLVYAPDLYDKDGTKVQDAVYNIPFSPDAVTDNIISGAGVVDSPAAGVDNVLVADTGAGAGIGEWLDNFWKWLTQNLWNTLQKIWTGIKEIPDKIGSSIEKVWDWLKTTFWDAIDAIRGAVSSVWTWCEDFWNTLCDTAAMLFVPSADYWDDKPSPASLLSDKFKIIGQFRDFAVDIGGNTGAPPDNQLGITWFRDYDVRTSPDPRYIRYYGVNFSFWSNHRDTIRNALRLVFIVLAVLSCIRVFMGVFGVGITSAVHVTARETKGGGSR